MKLIRKDWAERVDLACFLLVVCLSSGGLGMAANGSVWLGLGVAGRDTKNGGKRAFHVLCGFL